MRDGAWRSARSGGAGHGQLLEGHCKDLGFYPQEKADLFQALGKIASVPRML